ncbi:transcriptional regulator with XRE-family HTH domain [Nocardia sp. GAS34]|uniref:helix-turn-helix transcriptional regulator n=1 Tax=unclassified Nocardia TaxID=2637762 RepID=UPI003D213C97
MSDRRVLGDFLRARRARLNPEHLGLPRGAGRRQTPGLRREEVATLAGLSVDYYIRLEQGRDTNPSLAVLDALASALRLDEDERAHLYDLARAVMSRRPAPASVRQEPRPGLLLLLESVRPTPALILDQPSNVLAANTEALRLFDGMADYPAPERNLVRYVFTHPAARSTWVDWEGVTRDCVAHLRTVQGREPDSPALAAVVSQLCRESPEFADLWAHYDVKTKRGAMRKLHHPAVGRFTLTSEILTAPDGQRFVAFQAALGTPDHDALTLLGMVGGGVPQRPSRVVDEGVPEQGEGAEHEKR